MGSPNRVPGDHRHFTSQFWSSPKGSLLREGFLSLDFHGLETTQSPVEGEVSQALDEECVRFREQCQFIVETFPLQPAHLFPSPHTVQGFSPVPTVLESKTEHRTLARLTREQSLGPQINSRAREDEAEQVPPETGVPLAANACSLPNLTVSTQAFVLFKRCSNRRSQSDR